MLDPKLLRGDLDGVAAKLARRGYVLDITTLESLEEQRKAIQVETQALQAERNSRSKSIGKAKAAGEDIAPLLREVEGLGDQLKTKEAGLAKLQDELNSLLMGIPNIPQDDVPDGKGEDDNPEIRAWGERPVFDFAPKDHVDLGEALGQLDFMVSVDIYLNETTRHADVILPSTVQLEHDNYDWLFSGTSVRNCARLNISAAFMSFGPEDMQPT